MDFAPLPPCLDCGERFYGGQCFHQPGCSHEDRSMWRVLLIAPPSRLAKVVPPRRSARSRRKPPTCGHCGGERVDGVILHGALCRVAIARKYAPRAA